MAEMPTWWNVLQLAGIWAAAGATFYAARTALFIANKGNRIELKVSVAPAIVEGKGQDLRVEILSNIDSLNLNKAELMAKFNMITFEVTNKGTRETTVDEISWRHVFTGTARAVQFFSTDINGNKLPVSLKHSEQISFVFPLDYELNNYVQLFLRERSAISRWLIMRTLKIQAKVTTGEEFSARVSPAMLQLIKARWRAMKRETSEEIAIGRLEP